tara:strand:+ start:1144 stop:1503 length:360 start_codon:yes stop_codon:yes gene_type:complete
MENKKTKLTISGSSKKSYKNLDSSKTQGKKTVIIEKRLAKPGIKNSFSKPVSSKPFLSKNKYGGNLKPNFSSKTAQLSSDFEKRKLAEQRATKRLKGDSETDKKSKIGTKKKGIETYSF